MCVLPTHLLSHTSYLTPPASCLLLPYTDRYASCARRGQHADEPMREMVSSVRGWPELRSQMQAGRTARTRASKAVCTTLISSKCRRATSSQGVYMSQF